MLVSAADLNTLRSLAGRYSEIAHLDIQRQRLARYTSSNGLEKVRPIVLIDEVPWGEIRDPSLVNICSPELSWLETRLRHVLYQWDHFQVDLLVPPVFQVTKHVRCSGIGIAVDDIQIQGDSGAYIAAHEYRDQLQNEADLERLRLPEVSYDRESTEAQAAVARQVFAGLMEVELVGHYLQCNLWDQISVYRGVDSLLMDLAMRPEFMHATVRRFAEIAAAQFRQYEELELLDAKSVLLHCTPACAPELPAPDYAGKVRRQDVWGRCAAQIFGSVSPDMHDEFDLAYNEKLFQDCGLLYYGCCEPMDAKVDILRKRFKNLRKISITPWANPERAAENIGGDFVLAAKPNPAFVASSIFRPEPVRQEIARYCEACQRHGTTLEFVLKDISTIANNPGNLTEWAATVDEVISQYYG